MDSKPLVFLNCAIEDVAQAKPLARQLSKLGFVPWIPAVNVLPGKHTPRAITAVINTCAFFLVCLTRAWNETPGAHQADCRAGLEKMKEYSEEDTFLIPVLLEPEATLPSYLREIGKVNYFEKNGRKNLANALCEAMRQREKKARDLRKKKISQQTSQRQALASSHWPPRQLIQAIVGEQEDNAARCSVMIGSGLSERAGYPSWSDLLIQATQLAGSGKSRNARVQVRRLAQSDPLGFMALVKQKKPASYYKLIKQLFAQEGKKRYSNLHEYLLDTDFHFYLTTNFDCCLENAARDQARLAEGGVFYYPDFIKWQAIQNRHGAICHLHGFLYRYDLYWKESACRADQIVLTAEDFFTLYSYPCASKLNLTNDAIALLDSVFQEGTLLFVGYSFSDPVWHKLLSRFDGYISENARRNRHYALIPLTDEIESPETYKNYLLDRYGIDAHFFLSSVDRQGRVDFSGLEDCLKRLKEEKIKYKMWSKHETKIQAVPELRA